MRHPKPNYERAPARDVSGGVNMYWNRRDKSRPGELAEWQASSRFYLIFHTIARAFDDEGLRMPSPGNLQDLIETMKREKATLILHAPVYSPRIPEFVAGQVGGKVRMLPAHVGGVPEAKDYFAFFDYLLRSLVEALQ